jgi:hypothetical protein
MKILYINNRNQSKKYQQLEDAVEDIRNGKFQMKCSQLAWKIGISTVRKGDGIIDEAQALPIINFALGEKKRYTGLVLVSFPAEGNEQLVKMRKLAVIMPQTTVCFRGSSGKSLKIVARFTLPDGSLPGDEKEIRLFHEHAFSKMMKAYEAQLGVKAEKRKPNIQRGCRVSSDESIYFNENAVAFVMEQPTAPLALDIQRSILNKDGTTKFRTSIPGYNDEQMMMTKFQCCYSSFEQSDYEELDIYLLELAKKCQRCGIQEEFAVRRLLHISALAEYEFMVRRCFHTVYGTGVLGTESSIPPIALQTLLLRDFFENRYRFRRNEVTGQYEYIELGTHMFDWSLLTKEVCNTITQQVLLEGINSWDKDIRRYIESANIELYNPIRDYIHALPEWDGTDRVTAFAKRVPNDNKYWQKYFHRWMLGMVAQWMGVETEYGLTMVPLLVGEQGDGKSTFCKNILPPELRDYYTDRIDFSNRNDAERALSRFALINVDEFDSITKSQVGFLKHILQKTSYMQRKLYTQSIVESQRYAAFVATTNDPTPLTDPTGSRRYLCIRTTGKIDTRTKIDYQQIYAQLHAELKNGSSVLVRFERGKSDTDRQQGLPTLRQPSVGVRRDLPKTAAERNTAGGFRRLDTQNIARQRFIHNDEQQHRHATRQNTLPTGI